MSSRAKKNCSKPRPRHCQAHRQTVRKQLRSAVTKKIATGTRNGRRRPMPEDR